MDLRDLSNQEEINHTHKARTQVSQNYDKNLQQSQEKIHNEGNQDGGQHKFGEDEFLQDPEWQSEKPAEKSNKGKKELATLLLSLQLHKMGFTYPKYEERIEEYIERINFEVIDLNELSYWVAQSKTEVIEQILPFKKSLSSMKQKQTTFSVNKKQQDEGEKNQKQIQSLHKKPPLLCSICFQMTQKYEERHCNHYFCNSCIKSHILQSMESGDYDLRCPMYSCPNNIENEIVKKLLTSSQFEKYQYFKKKVELEKNPDNRFCSKPDCGELLVPAQNGSLRCEKCNSEFCQICLQPYHKNSSCDKNILKYFKETFHKFKIKKCPQCSAPIQKIDGCNHMCCKKCKQQFCWICLSKYTHHHYRYYNCCGCPGLQFGQEQQLPKQRCKQMTFWILSPLLLLIFISIFCIGLPLFIIFNFLTKPCEWASQDYEMKCEKKLVSNVCCCCLPACFIKFIACFMFIPRSIVYALFMAPGHYFCYFFHGIHNAFV